jgi:hypothetical protein
MPHIFTSIPGGNFNEFGASIAFGMGLFGGISAVESVSKEASLHSRLVHDDRVFLIIASVAGNGHNAVGPSREFVGAQSAMPAGVGGD